MNGEKVALVTEATSGIGQATAKLLSHRRFRVFGTARRPHSNSAGPGETELVPLDVHDGQSVRACLQTVMDPYPSPGTNTTPPTSHPFFLGKFAFADMNK